jgi:hypothetical protein
MQFSDQTSTKNKNNNNDNSILKKINVPVTSAARLLSHPARSYFVCTSTDG